MVTQKQDKASNVDNILRLWTGNLQRINLMQNWLRVWQAKKQLLLRPHPNPLLLNGGNSCLRGQTSANSSLLEQLSQWPPSVYIKLVYPKSTSLRASAEGQSIYKCMHPGCPYSTAQFAQCCTHIHRKHLGVCIKCRITVTATVLGLWTYRSSLKMSTWTMRINGLNQCWN